VKAQLAALQQGDVFGASCFSMRAGRGISSRKTSECRAVDAACTAGGERNMQAGQAVGCWNATTLQVGFQLGLMR